MLLILIVRSTIHISGENQFCAIILFRHFYIYVEIGVLCSTCKIFCP